MAGAAVRLRTGRSKKADRGLARFCRDRRASSLRSSAAMSASHFSHVSQFSKYRIAVSAWLSANGFIGHPAWLCLR